MCVCVKEGRKKREINRKTDRAHCMTAYLRHKPFLMLCWGLCSINGSAYRFKLQIASAEFSPLSPRLTRDDNEKSAGSRLRREFSRPYPAHRRYMAGAAISSAADRASYVVRRHSRRCRCTGTAQTQTQPPGVSGRAR